MKTRIILPLIKSAALLVLLSTLNAPLSTQAQGTAFTYQGRLNDGANPASGIYDLRFAIYDALTAGATVAGPLTNSAVTVSNGLFTMALDFGAVFNGAPGWLEIAVRTNGGGSFATLTPRQQLTPAPYAIMANNASNLLGTLPAGQLSGRLPSDLLAGTYDGTLTFGSFFNSFTGDGTNLRNLDANNLVFGTVPSTRLNGTYASALTFNNPANNFTGAGGGLTSLNASQLTSGTVSSARLSGTYASALTFNNPANSFSGAGSGLTSLNASRLASGTVPAAVLDNAWKVGGNAGTTSDFIGTTDDQSFDIKVNNVRAMRYRLTTDAAGVFTNAPNVIGGSSVNSANLNVVGATIAGGGGNLSDGTPVPNIVTANYGTVSGGYSNTASGVRATVGGGDHNTASGDIATVGGGTDNISSGTYSTVGGGSRNYANGAFPSTVGGGSDNSATGDLSTVPGGNLNTAAGTYSFAAGHRAKADHDGSFVWADGRANDFHSTVVNGFFVRSVGGVKFVTAIDGAGNATAGVRVVAGDSAWSTLSDRNAKKNIEPLNCQAVLDKLAQVPVSRWNYKWEKDGDVPNLGPMAQDFKAAFYPGRDDKSISTLEFDGVELAAIQGLNQKVEDRSQRSEDRSRKLEEKLEQKETEITELKQRLEALEKIIRNPKSN